MTDQDVTIVVSSCDAYSDCWDAFFMLFDAYWPDCPYPLVLVSETKLYDGGNGRIRSFLACKETGKRRLAWGGGMIECLRRLESRVVLYLQEDHFLQGRVDQDLVAEFASFVAEMSWTHETTMHIGLCPRSSHGPFHLTEHPLLWEVDRQARYRFSLQPGLWNRENLLQFLRYHDTPWHFEESSHLRGRRARSRVLTLNRHVFGPQRRQVYPFDPAGGIVQGKWVRASVEELFRNHGIEVDFALRGCLDDGHEWAPGRRGRVEQVRLWCALLSRLEVARGCVNEFIDRFRY